jgi:hypothetical protein
MFGTLNQRWLILLQEREVISAMSIAKPQKQHNLLELLLNWGRQKLKRNFKLGKAHPQSPAG